MSRNYNRALAYHTKIVERNQKKEGKLRGYSSSKPFFEAFCILVKRYDQTTITL